MNIKKFSLFAFLLAFLKPAYYFII